MRLSFCSILFLLSTTLSTAFAKTIDERIQELIPLFKLQAMPTEIKSNEDLYNLGEALFFNRLLSGNKNISCADCHNPLTGTGDKLPLGLGQGLVKKNNQNTQGQAVILARNTPALYNLGQVSSLFWDSRVARHSSADNGVVMWTTPQPLGPWKDKLNSALAAQALFPILSPEEMRGLPGQNKIADILETEKAWQAITDQVAAPKGMRNLFEAAFPNQKPHIYMIGNALAEFQRVRFNSISSPYDKYLEGDIAAITENQKKGMELFFGKADCGRCHNGTQLSNFAVHSLAIPQWGPKDMKTDKGVGNWYVSDDFGNFRFRVAPLRNLGYTAPYMHNGYFKTLREVVAHYNHFPRNIRHLNCPQGYTNYSETFYCDADPTRNEERLTTAHNSLRMRLNLTDIEIDQIVDFLNSMNDPNFQ